MCESDWLASDDAQAMLAYLDRREPETARVPIIGVSARKLRLFACACWRLVGAAAASTARNHPEVADAGEAWADSGAPPAGRPYFGYPLEPDAAAAARGMTQSVAYVEAAQVAALLREIVGNPFRPVRFFPTQSIDAVMRSNYRTRRLDDGREQIIPDWLTPTVLTLAQAAYDERLPDGTLDPARLAVLSDALEEAGCDGVPCPTGCKKIGGVYQINTGGTPYDSGWETCPTCYGSNGLVVNPILAHLRSPGPHVRGCWALDLLLGKE